MIKYSKFDHTTFRLIISNISGYGTFPVLPKGTLRSVNICPQLDELKSRVLDYLLLQQNKRKIKPTHWSAAWEIHPASGLPHLDILIVFQRKVQPYTNGFDYLIKDFNIKQIPASSVFTPGHVWITAYSPKKLNRAILQYGKKQDPSVITNITLQTQQQLVQIHLLKADPYRYLQLQMLKNPLHFNLQQYCRQHDLFKQLTGWSTIKSKLKDSQTAAANLLLKQKPGFRFIDRTLIEAKLTPEQLKIYDSWPGYQTIVDYLNQMVVYKGLRDPKTPNLFITGPPNCGKSALVWHPNPHDHFNPISKYCSVYPMGMSQWFPKYQSDVYHCIYWNEAKFTSYSYDTILKLLDGSPLDLSNKGSVSRKVDNPLIIMTSNLTLQQLIQQKFNYSEYYRQLARQNLTVRVQNVVVPPGYNLFLLQKLLLSKV